LLLPEYGQEDMQPPASAPAILEGTPGFMTLAFDADFDSNPTKVYVSRMDWFALLKTIQSILNVRIHQSQNQSKADELAT